MAHRPSALALAAALATAAAGCGSDAVKKEIARMRATCGTLTGQTVAEAATALQGQFVISSACSNSLGPTGPGDECPGAPGPYTSPICLVGFEVCALGTSACSSGPFGGGCAFACILRVAATTPDQVTSASTVCATEFVSSQSVTPVSGLPCQ